MLKERPAEISAFIAALLAVFLEIGVDVSEGLIIAIFVIIGLLPAVVTYFVNLYREALRDEQHGQL